MNITRGLAITGARGAAFRHAASLAADDDKVVIADGSLLGPTELIELAQRFRSRGQKLIVVASSEGAIPGDARRNLACHVQV